MKTLTLWLCAVSLASGPNALAWDGGERMPDLNGAVTPARVAALKVWAAKYKEAGLVVVGVHTPEFEFERDPLNVRNALADLATMSRRSE